MKNFNHIILSLALISISFVQIEAQSLVNFEISSYMMNDYDGTAFSAVEGTLVGVNRSLETGTVDSDAILGGIALLGHLGDKRRAKKEKKRLEKRQDEERNRKIKADQSRFMGLVKSDNFPSFALNEKYYCYIITKKEKSQLAFSRPFEINANDGKLPSTKEIEAQFKAKTKNKDIAVKGPFKSFMEAQRNSQKIQSIAQQINLKLKKPTEFAFNQDANSSTKEYYAQTTSYNRRRHVSITKEPTPTKQVAKAKTIVNKSAKKITQKRKAIQSLTFRIQLLAATKTQNTDGENWKDIGPIKILNDKGYFQYVSTIVFPSYEKAQQALQDAKAKGFKAASILTYQKGEYISALKSKKILGR